MTDAFESMPKSKVAAAFWLLDTGGAIGFAGFLAHFLGHWAMYGEAQAAPFQVVGVITCGVIRAVAQGGALIVGQGQASRLKQVQRGVLLRALLPTAMQRAALPGEDMRIAIDDVEAGEGLIARFMPLRTAAVLSPLMIAAAVAMVSWVAAVIMLGTLIPFAIGMILAGYAGKGEAERQLAALTHLSGLFVDRVASLPLILANGAEERVTRQIGGAAREVAERTIAVLRVAFVSSAVLEFFAALSVALVAMYCGFALLGILPFPAPESLNLTHAFFALTLAPEFYLGMRRMAAAYHDKQQGEAAKASISAALGEAAGHFSPAITQISSGPVESLSVDSFRIIYPDGTQVGPISAHWEGPGLHVLSGVTGAGKSSILHALLGLVPIANGEIRLDGLLTTPSNLILNIGWAGQRTLLLPGSLADNLLLGAHDADIDSLEPLLAAMGLSDMIAARGEDLAVDSRGTGLSGGERRRIGLVRAIASGRSILLLDEPTADLDSDTASYITALLLELAKDRLIIVATHDKQLSDSADSVTVVS